MKTFHLLKSLAVLLAAVTVTSCQIPLPQRPEFSYPTTVTSLPEDIYYYEDGSYEKTNVYSDGKTVQRFDANDRPVCWTEYDSLDRITYQKITLEDGSFQEDEWQLVGEELFHRLTKIAKMVDGEPFVLLEVTYAVNDIVAKKGYMQSALEREYGSDMVTRKKFCHYTRHNHEDYDYACEISTYKVEENGGRSGAYTEQMYAVLSEPVIEDNKAVFEKLLLDERFYDEDNKLLRIDHYHSDGSGMNFFVEYDEWEIPIRKSWYNEEGFIYCVYEYNTARELMREIWYSAPDVVEKIVYH